MLNKMDKYMKTHVLQDERLTRSGPETGPFRLFWDPKAKLEAGLSVIHQQKRNS